MKRLLFALALLVLALSHTNSPAAKVKVWQQSTPHDFEKAHFKQAVITSEGTLRLSRLVKPLANLEAAHVWDVVEDKAGNFWVATGDEGKVFKVTADGKASVVHTSNTASQILCLAATPDGSVYAGTGPGGKVLRFAPGANAQVVADHLDGYVWSLAYDAANQTLYAGTGPKGKIYQINADGKASVFYATKQEHILALVLGNGVLYAGTDKGGLIYRIDTAKAKGFVVYHAQQAEVRSLLVTNDAVYAGTASAITKRPPGSSPRSNPSGGTPAGSQPFTPANEKSSEKSPEKSNAKPVQAGASPPPTIGAEEIKGSPASAPSSPAVGDNSVYRIAADGTVRELFRDKVMVLALLRHQGRLLVGTGMQGQLFEVDEATKERTEIARLDHGQIHCLLQRKDGSVILGTGDPGKLYVLDDRYAAKGTVTSEVLDARIISHWGALSWKAATPAGTLATVAVRSGNTSEPDETWSDWSKEETDASSAKALAPAARYFQYRATLTTSDPTATPEFRHLALRYKTTNQPPEITSFEVPDLDANPQESPKKLRLRWNATDPNEDELTFSLHFRKEGWKDWVLLDDALDKREFEWDTTTIPSGMYQFKVTATDRRDNSPEEARTAEKISPPVPVTHLPPAVTLKFAGFEGDQAIVEASASDTLVRLTDAAFSVDGKRWTSIFPSDGLFDSKTERFRFKTESLRPGTHVLVLRVRNAAGILGAGDVTIALPKTK